jgi:hypothetical protein
MDKDRPSISDWITIGAAIIGTAGVLLSGQRPGRGALLAVGVLGLLISVLVHILNPNNFPKSLLTVGCAAVSIAAFLIAFMVSPFAIFDTAYLVVAVIGIPLGFGVISLLRGSGRMVDRVVGRAAGLFSLVAVGALHYTVVAAAAASV